VLTKSNLPEEVFEQLEDILSYIEEGDLEDAIDIIDALAEEFPDSYEVAFHRIRVYRTIGINSEMVLPLIESCHATDPSDLEVWTMLIEELAELGFFGLAEKELELLKSSTNSDFEELYPEDFSNSIQEAARIERSDFFGDSAESGKKYLLLNLAEKAIYFGDFAIAKKYCDDLTKQAPESVRTWTIVARFHFLSSDIPAAITNARRAIDTDSSYGEPYYILSLSELILGKTPAIYPELCTVILERGVSYQAYYLILTGQYDALLSLYEKYNDIVSSHPDSARFFECLAFVLYSKNEVQRANSLWQFANSLEPEGSLLAELHLQDDSDEMAEKPFLFFGPSEFPCFFSRELEKFAQDNDTTLNISFSEEHIKLLPGIYTTILKLGDAALVRLTSSILAYHSGQLSEESVRTIHTSMLEFIKGKRLSAPTRAFVAQLLRFFGDTSVSHIYWNDRKVPLLFHKLLPTNINPFIEGTDEFFYYEVIMENMHTDSLEELGDMCRSMFEKSYHDPYLGIEYVRILIALGKFDDADFIVKDLCKKNPDLLPLQLLKYDIQLPQNITQACDLVSILSDKRLTPLEFREYQFLKSSLALLDGSPENSLIELDTLELLLPVFHTLCKAKKETLQASSVPQNP
jgi:tetratricopeptide (TPR) repeat protein